jgi:hypothetical protein
LLSLLGDQEIRSFGEDHKNPPSLLNSKTPSSESKKTIRKLQARNGTI